MRKWAEELRAKVTKHFSSSRKVLPELELKIWKDIEKESLAIFRLLSEQTGKRITPFKEEELVRLLRDLQAKGDKI